ncbi:hypothetical protein [Nitrosovibrio tenuis]|uniref:Uncharacterized protein n=1 Tax=Nitrosovibrio tenuis TaxID=1233 RepID=A0A1H7GID1_9PROT|nr:hypothetical protein [Nitrosovibrio tenuis]SEK37804.1 hypothetical protein SAMN05216387_101285 [Nitrosovibrio tenuis]
MKTRPNTRVLRLFYALPWIISAFTLSGCVSPIALNRAVGSYDEAIVDAASKQLLMNIARAHHRQPIHFTGVSNIAATFDFRFSAGGTPALTGNAGGLLMPVFGGSVAENPTISIVPIEGEEFTKRLLTPFQQSKLTLLLRQRYDIDLLLRLMAQEVRVQGPTQEIIYRNTPPDSIGYETFRRIVLHLSAIQDQNQLYAEPLTLERTWTVPAGSVSAEGFQALQKEFFILYNQQDNTYTLRKQLVGPILITNYDPSTLPANERAQLNERAGDWITHDLAFDIRANHPGGEWPMKGVFRLRSFHSILYFLGHSFGDEPEYHVGPDPRTPAISKNENPISTMELIVSDSAPSQGELFIHSHGKYFVVNTGGPLARWNRDSFQMLYLLFQMTITDLPRVGVPSITIAK